MRSFLARLNSAQAAILVCLILICGLTALAQTATAPLSGAVTDQNGAVVSGATVAVKNVATGAEFQATTASNGTFTVPALNAGAYVVTVEAKGFKKTVVQDVKIDAGVPATANIALEIG